MVHFLQLSLAECVPCLGVMGTMYLEDVMSRVPRSPHSLQALLLSHTSSLDVPKLLFALLPAESSSYCFPPASPVGPLIFLLSLQSSASTLIG